MLLPSKNKTVDDDYKEYDVVEKTSNEKSSDNIDGNLTTVIRNNNSDWINRKWRPMMGWMYMTVCIFDFILFPIGFTVVQFWEVEAVNDAFRQWSPLTLQGAGLFHMAMGAILGITAWSRGQEKIKGKD